ncbi:MAG TPA: O-antigen ligase family protein [Gaiellaceae bacterium]|nr:O-antigen ligase family protein [Gaiellaceae bacterium]
MTRSRLTSFLFLFALFCSTFENVAWGGAESSTLYIADIPAALFVVAFAVEWFRSGERWIPGAAAVLIVFLAAFLLVDLIGFFNMETKQALDQFGKGIAKWLVHFLFVVAGVVYLANRSRGYFWRAFGWFTAGVTVNAIYGIFQLLAAEAGHNLDAVMLEPITRVQSHINVYGGVAGHNVYRTKGLTRDPNHLAIMLLVPLLVLIPLYLRLERGHPYRKLLAVLIPFLLVVDATTLSRSGALGLAVGLLVLVLVYGRQLLSRALVAPLAVFALPVAYLVWTRRHFFDVVLHSRLSGGHRSVGIHFQVYDFVPQVLHMHPLFGLGYNNFSVYYEFVTGKTNWGPHSYFVALLVEGGLVGTAVTLVFLLYVFRRLARGLQVGRFLGAAGDPLTRLVRPLGWGLTAALAATIAANSFYLTMPFFYFFVLVMLAVALPTVFARPVAALARA